jgi:hypothetical protein
MKLQEFKQKYFDNTSYWVNKENYKKLQEIALEVGCLCHTGKAEIKQTGRLKLKLRCTSCLIDCRPLASRRGLTSPFP